MAATALPVNFDMRPYRGDDYLVGFVYDETDPDTGDSLITDIAGWAAHLQIRSAPGGSVWLDLTDVSGLGLALGDEGIEISVHIPAAETASDSWAGRTDGSWDVQLTNPSGIVTTPFAGRFLLRQDITRTVTPSV